MLRIHTKAKSIGEKNLHDYLTKHTMRKLLVALAMLPQLMYAQKVYVTHNRSEADLLIYRSKYFCEAHLVVSRTYDFTNMPKYHWFFVNSIQSADPGWVIYYTDKREEADTCVYFTDRKGLLGNYCPVKTPVESDIYIQNKKKKWPFNFKG